MTKPFVGQHVIANGYPGTITRVCEWSDSMVEVRLASGTVCVDFNGTDCRGTGEYDDPPLDPNLRWTSFGPADLKQGAGIIPGLQMIAVDLREAEDELVGDHPGDAPRVEWALHHVRKAREQMARALNRLGANVIE